jgi:hypothetical protein
MGIKTVVNKTGFIENAFRVLPMEVIAGEPNFMVQLVRNAFLSNRTCLEHLCVCVCVTIREFCRMSRVASSSLIFVRCFGTLDWKMSTVASYSS